MLNFNNIIRINPTKQSIHEKIHTAVVSLSFLTIICSSLSLTNKLLLAALTFVLNCVSITEEKSKEQDSDSQSESQLIR